MSDYLQKHSLYPPLIEMPPDPNLQMVIVIPAYDEPDWEASLEAISQCAPGQKAVEVILLINDAEKTEESLKQNHREMLIAVKEWAHNHEREGLRFYPIYCSGLPNKQAGVGLARKIGMDEAVRRLEAVGCPEGVIVGFDADSQCDPNYLQEIERYFGEAPNRSAASIYYEHPLEGELYEEAIYEAITQYELHLRYFNNAKRYAGFPFAFETIGSAMTVRASAYQKQGGMNRRKAGEDFYFLNKFIALGHFGEINGTRVIPSPRPSDRVPFGTGRAVGQLLEAEAMLSTYAPESFEALRSFFRSISKLYQQEEAGLVHFLEEQPAAIRHFLEEQEIGKKMKELNQHTSSILSFEKRFFQWFNPFLIMKYVHFARDHYYPDIAVDEAASWLAKVYLRDGEQKEKRSTKEYLKLFRKWDRRRR